MMLPKQGVALTCGSLIKQIAAEVVYRDYNFIYFRQVLQIQKGNILI